MTDEISADMNLYTYIGVCIFFPLKVVALFLAIFSKREYRERGGGSVQGIYTLRAVFIQECQKFRDKSLWIWRERLLGIAALRCTPDVVILLFETPFLSLFLCLPLCVEQQKIYIKEKIVKKDTRRRRADRNESVIVVVNTW